jgi:hypothetical protein
MRKLIFILMIAIVPISGCSERAPPTKEARYLLADMATSGNNLESYRFVTETVQKIEGLTTSIEPSELEIKSLEEGDFNLSALNMRISINRTVRSGAEDVSSMDQEVYVIEDVAKFKVDDVWSQAALQDPEDFWTSQNIAKELERLLKSSQLEYSGSEILSGEDCSRIDVLPDRRAYETILAEQLGSMLPLAYLNITDLYEESSVNWTLWISEDSGLPMMEIVNIKFSVTPEMMELPYDLIKDFMIKVEMTTTTRYGDYNRPLGVKLPEGQRIEPMFSCACG